MHMFIHQDIEQVRENEHKRHQLDYGWVWHRPTWGTFGGAAMHAADPAARSSSPHLAAQYWCSYLTLKFEKIMGNIISEQLIDYSRIKANLYI